MLQLRARTVPSLVDAAVTDSVVAEAGMTLSVLARVVVARVVVVKVVVVKAVVVKVVLVRAVDVVDDEAVVADVAEAVQVALPLARRRLLLPASKSGNPRMSVRTCWFWDLVSKVVFQRGISRSVFSRLASAISGPV